MALSDIVTLFLEPSLSSGAQCGEEGDVRKFLCHCAWVMNNCHHGRMLTSASGGSMTFQACGWPQEDCYGHCGTRGLGKELLPPFYPMSPDRLDSTMAVCSWRGQELREVGSFLFFYRSSSQTCLGLRIAGFCSVLHIWFLNPFLKFVLFFKLWTTVFQAHRRVQKVVY